MGSKLGSVTFWNKHLLRVSNVLRAVEIRIGNSRFKIDVYV